MTEFQGVRLPDTQIGNSPEGGLDIPGSYWKVLVRDKHPEYPRPIDVLNHPEDRAWWGNDSRHDQNLTGCVWGYVSPNGLYGMMSIHTVREHEDGTISVLPGDGSSNSILISWDGEVDGVETHKSYHGYIYNGVWREC